MQPTLRLYEDVLSNDGEVALPALPRFIFVTHGTLIVADRTLHDEEVFSGEGAVALKAGSEGATLWRWEFSDAAGGAVAGRGVVSREKLSAVLETLPQGALLLRGDSVIRDRASAACSKAASVSTPTAARRPTAPAAPGTRPDRTACSPRPPTARPASSAS
jgi:hypothetical protein